MLTISPNKTYSNQEYLRFEKSAPEKHEYFNGKIKKRKSVTHVVSEITAHLTYLLLLGAKSSSKKFRLYNSDMKIQIPEYNAFVYPDAVVVCEKPELWEGRKDVIINPLLIVEVASPSTEGYDREVKFDKYRTLSSLKEYLLIMQTMPLVSQYSREEEDLWRTTSHKGMDSKIPLRSLGCEISLADIYEDIVFEND